MELGQVTHQGALPLDATLQGFHQETSDRFVSQRLLAVILRHVSLLQSHRAFTLFYPKLCGHLCYRSKKCFWDTSSRVSTLKKETLSPTLINRLISQVGGAFANSPDEKLIAGPKSAYIQKKISILCSSVRFGFCKGGCLLYVVQQFMNSLISSPPASGGEGWSEGGHLRTTTCNFLTGQY